MKLILFGIMLFCFISLGTKDYKTSVSDSVRFSNEYKDISKNNVFKYVGEHEVLEILNGKSGIFFFGFPSNIWCHYYADYLNEIAILHNITEIYYYDFKKDRNMNNVTYNGIVEKLRQYLVINDLGQMDLSAPTVLIVKNGNILYFDDEIAFIRGDITPEAYFNDYKKNIIKANFNLEIQKYLEDDSYEWRWK